ncbi:hypothetical protein [Streptomyces sp. NPDC056721]|uniref:hypothetical protein n=1 Tax=unclassified Streptomyces TaxID=2593676 RepID=UPI0036B277BB
MLATGADRARPPGREAIGWWQRQGWIDGNPTIGIERRPAPPDRTKALAENQIAALWRLDVALREKTFWKLLYESAARADEVLCLNVEDLYSQDKRGRITAKGGATEWIHWQSGTAQLLPRLIAAASCAPSPPSLPNSSNGTATKSKPCGRPSKRPRARTSNFGAASAPGTPPAPRPPNIALVRRHGLSGTP